MTLNLTIAIELLLIALAIALFTKRMNRPYTIALVIWGLILGLAQFIEPVRLSKELVLTVFLPPLLFDGALHIRAKVLRNQAGLVFGLALAGTLFTALVIGAAAHILLGFDWLTGLLLGAIIAPTDPVSVLAIFRRANVDRDLSTIVESESLFNDGIAVVLYTILLGAISGLPPDPGHVITDFALVVGGGAVVGLGLGMITSQVLKRVDDHLVEVLVTLVLVYGTYLLAEHLHLSGVIAVAVAGLAASNYGVSRTSVASRQSIHLFWEIVSFLVNSVVFLLIGFELQPNQLLEYWLSILIIFVVLLSARALSVYAIGGILHKRTRRPSWRWRHLIIWAGLRGAVPIALALGLPNELPSHDKLVAIVFGVVLLSLIGQGLSLPALIKRLGLEKDHSPQEHEHSRQTEFA